MSAFQDVFISYGRADSKQFAVHLYERLSALGYQVWLDQTDIPFAVNYQTHIDRSIETVHNFVFVISPHAVNSPYCALEIDQALKYHKRIIPLMHVETIDFEVWRERHPQGTAADWQNYQAQGLHSSFLNIDRRIAKINWINFREGIDDFDQSLVQLTQTLDDQQDHVHRHTHYLTVALNWRRNQRRIDFLLKGDDCRSALGWLEQTFEANPPFCRPTDMHCEFIAESVKYADNQMAQVCLCYADANPSPPILSVNPEQSTQSEDATSASTMPLASEEGVPDSPLPGSPGERIRYALMRAGLTVWDRHYDLSTGESVSAAIDRGVEASDNLVFLLSPEALQSSECLQQLSYAFSMNKRVVPVLVAAVDRDQAPPAMQKINWIDLRDRYRGEDLSAEIRELIRTLLQDAPYYRTHKLLLLQALKWERQRRNPSILLRGRRLQTYQNWLTVAQQRQWHRPLQLHRTFIAASLAQPPAQTLDVYLICDPTDLAFARKLNDMLQLQSKSTWFEQLSLTAEEEPQDEATQALANSENCLFVLSPQAVKNAQCLAQLKRAHSLNKRIVAVAFQPMPPEPLGHRLDDLPKVDFSNQGGDFAANFGTLYRILESDPDHVAFHTRLLVKATEWENADRDDGYLLRSGELKRAAAWLAQAHGKTPTPNLLQKDYIAASQQLPLRRIKRRTLGVCSAAATLLVAALRLMGTLQALELGAYDFFLRHRPSELPDDRMLMVMVDDSSGTWLREQMKQGHYQPGIGTIPDAALNEAIDQLLAHQPAVIGLDFYRDFEAETSLGSQLAQTNNLIGLCKSSYNGIGVEKPPEVPLPRVGFNDFNVESPPQLFRQEDSESHDIGFDSDFIRRHHLKQGADPDFCPTKNAFSLVIARKYLSQKGVQYTDPWPGEEGDAQQDMMFDQVTVPQLWAGGILVSHSSAYTPLDPKQLDGYQTMLNFRANQGNVQQFTSKITLKDVLTGQFDPKLVQGQIVVIGYEDVTDRSADFYDTPYGEVPGVILQGQMISQLVSAVLEDRPLLWWWPAWAEILWVSSWSLAAGYGIWILVRPGQMAVGMLTGLLMLGGTCYIALVWWGGWIPLIPAALAMVGSAGLVAIFTRQVRNP